MLCQIKWFRDGKLTRNNVKIKSKQDVAMGTYSDFSNAKRLLLDIYHDVKTQYFQGFLNELCFRYNRRYFGDKLFDMLLIAFDRYKNEF